MIAYPSPEAIEARVRDCLPEDGTPVLNRVMLVKVRQSFEASVGQEDYFRAVESLDGKNVIGRMRGAGGQVYLLQTRVPTAKSLPERELMAPTLAYLKGEFLGLLELPETSRSLVLDTSRMGPAKGLWARPDFVLVTVTQYRLMPGRHVDVHSFELKNTKGGSVLSVHEALAQTRFTHFGHFVWHLPRNARQEAKLPEVASQCEEHGIGLIRAYEPEDPANGWEVLKTPKRKPTPVGTVDGFLQERLSRMEQSLLVGAELGTP